MKKRKLCLLSLLAFMAFSKSNVNAQISLLKDYTHKDPAPIGKFQGIDFKEGGFSSLYPIAGTNGKEFWTISDRGVNIDAANANVTGCKPTYDKIYAFPTYAPKIHRIRVEGASIKVLQTITMKRPNGTGATGLINPTGFGSTSAELASTDTVQNCANFNTKTAAKDVWGIDSEGLVVDKEGNFWIAEEGGPTIWKLNKNGVVVKRYTPYANVPGAEKEDIAIDTVYKYRKNNRGFEGLAMTPNGKLYAIIQSPILYPTKTIGESSRIHRILEIDPKTDQMRMLAYLNDGVIGASGADQIRLRDWKIGDMAAINDNEFLVIEQALRGTTDRKFVYKINIAKATPVNSGLYSGSTLEALKDSTGLANNNIVPVAKTLFMDLLANKWPSNFEKAEGIALINDSTIAFVNDNDFGQYSPLENGVATVNNMESHLFVYGLNGKNKITGLVQPTPSYLEGFTGPSTLTTPYLQPSKQGVKFTSILTAGDSIGSYKMSGLADGTGAFDNGDGTFTLLVGHEIGNTLGVARAHGQKGAFISKWTINKNDLSVVKGNDLIQNVKLWDGTTYKTYNTANPSTLAAFNRFCSADLPEVNAFYNPKTGLGTQARIFMNGEEAGAEGRAFAHVVTGAEAGTTYELPRMGKYSFENAVANPFTGDKTVVLGTDDTTPGQVYVYVGTKSNTGNEIEKAGLTNGKLFGVAVTGLTTEISESIPANNTTFKLADLGNVESLTGAKLDTNSNKAGVTNFLRPEDGAWDPSNPNDFYFATTNAFDKPSRLWKLHFTDLANPELGGTITAVLDGTEGPKMIDNLTIDNAGHILLQEDPGKQSYLAKIWEYNTQTDNITQIAVHDETRFVTGSANYLTEDEESSGIIDVQSILGKGMFLLVDQAHYKNTAEIVEGGQILAMFNPSTAENVSEIEIKGNNSVINSNDITPQISDFTSFGSVALDKDITKTFKIHNLGNSDLKINDLFISGQDKNEFKLVNTFKDQIIIAANNSYALDVTFKTTSKGSKTAKIHILSNDFDEKEYSFNIAATGNDQAQGISSSQTPYLLPSKQGVKFTSILTAGDSIGTYKMAGLADGTGAFDNGDGTFTLLVGHEIGNTLGVARAHGQKGAFISKWTINKNDLSVVKGNDLIQNVKLWDGTTYKTYNTANPSTLAAFNRFCSADLPEVNAFYNPKTGLGTQARIFMNGEEAGAEGRAFAHVVTGAEAGTTYELPRMGKYSFENAVANPFTGDKTVVLGTDDTTPGQVYVYVGTKSNTGNEIEKAGLTNGKLFGVAVTGLTTEISESIPANNTTFKLADLGNVESLTGAKLDTNSNKAGVTNFLRPEDGAWDPSNPNDFYFATTNAFDKPSRLWKLHFTDLANPELGGTITAVLDGTEGPKMIDNLTIDNAGHILLQEDPGKQSYLAKIWEYNTKTDNITQIAVHDETRFVSGSANYLTEDEESSGIIDVQSILGKGMFLLVDQAHYKNTVEIVEGGQILAMFNPSTADSAVVITKQPNANYEVCENGTVSIAIEAKHATKYIWQAGKNGSYTDVVDNANFLGATTPTLSISNASKLLNGLSYRCLVSRNTGITETSILTTLTVNQPSTSTTSKEACGSYDWNGKNYTQSGEYTFSTKNKVGCDSIATLKLKINQASNSTTSKEACGSYDWNGKNYTQSGEYTFSTKNKVGCDSIATLKLNITTINDSIKFVNQTLSVSQQNAVYSWFNCETKKVIDNETKQTFTPSANGTYAAIINVKSCIDTTACIAISKVGVDELDASQVQIFPNPAHDHITVQLDSDAKDVKYTLIDASGKVVTSGSSTNNGTINIPVHSYTDGMYVLQVALNEYIQNYKVSIKH